MPVGQVLSGSLNIQVYGSSGLLGSETVNASGVNTFFGVSSNGAAITKVDISNASPSASVLIDNLTFGTPSSIVNYSSRSTFLAANPGRSVEGFESANVAAGSYAIFPGPVNSQTANAAFAAGGVLPGFTINSASSLVVTGTGTTPGGTKELGVAGPSAMQIIFSVAQTAVGMDLITSTGPGNIGSAVFDINVYGAGGLIESEQVNVSGLDTFFGISTAGGVTEIDITEVGGNSSVFIDNLTFLPSAVPEPSSIVLGLLGAVAIVGCRRLRTALHF